MNPEQSELQGFSEHRQPDPAAAPLLAPAQAVTAPRRPGLLRFSAVELLVALGLLLFTSPFVEGLKNGQIIEGMLVTVVLVSSVLAVGGRRQTLLIALLLVTPALVGRWGNHLWPDVVPAELYLIPAMVFLSFIVMQLLRFVLRAPRVNTEVLCGGIAGYVLMGLLWSMAYLLVAKTAPNAFAISAGPPDEHSMDPFTAFYFSFATLTTIGYGDITPVSRVARMLSVMEAMTGMFYVAILISRLVALHTSNPPTPASPQPPNHS
jgi:hypothetical protein